MQRNNDLLLYMCVPCPHVQVSSVCMSTIKHPKFSARISLHLHNQGLINILLLRSHLNKDHIWSWLLASY